MDKNTIKLLNEDFAREVKSMITRSDLSEDAKRNVYYRIMEFKQPLLKQGIRPELASKDVDRAEFYMYFDAWNKNTRYLSNPNRIVNDSEFINIIHMGDRAVPFIYEELCKGGDFIAFAMLGIVGKDLSEAPTESLIEASKKWKKYIEENYEV